ncbi:MAG TPA: hypothetical protein VJ808_12845 [Gemmatimonadales bacterium]|nr:hypothetical protein [Gemmatimonadales bacterium]
MIRTRSLLGSSWGARLLLLSVTLVPLGCSSPAERIERATRTASSWAATARLTSEALRIGSLPRGYASQILEAALERKRQLEGQPEWRSVPGEIRGRLEDAARELAASLDEGSDSLPRP